MLRIVRCRRRLSELLQCLAEIIRGLLLPDRRARRVSFKVVRCDLHPVHDPVGLKRIRCGAGRRSGLRILRISSRILKLLLYGTCAIGQCLLALTQRLSRLLTVRSVWILREFSGFVQNISLLVLQILQLLGLLSQVR